jgi:hypothetical protein
MTMFKLHVKHTLIALFAGLSSAMAQNDGHDMNHAIGDTLLIGSLGLEVYIPHYLKADSVRWQVTNLTSHEVENYLFVDPYTLTPVTVYENATVNVWVRSKGLWYKQLIQFNAVTQNELNGTLTAPVIANARYHWYFEGEIVSMEGNEYVPTQIGSYRVAIFWDNVNARVATQSSAAFVFEVTKLGSVTAINDGISAGDIALYPSIASEEIHVANVKGSFNYAIESLSAGTTTSGTGFGAASINIANLASGMYLVRIKTEDREVSRKLIID